MKDNQRKHLTAAHEEIFKLRDTLGSITHETATNNEQSVNDDQENTRKSVSPPGSIQNYPVNNNMNLDDAEDCVNQSAKDSSRSAENDGVAQNLEEFIAMHGELRHDSVDSHVSRKAEITKLVSRSESAQSRSSENQESIQYDTSKSPAPQNIFLEDRVGTPFSVHSGKQSPMVPFEDRVPTPPSNRKVMSREGSAVSRVSITSNGRVSRQGSASRQKLDDPGSNIAESPVLVKRKSILFWAKMKTHGGVFLLNPMTLRLLQKTTMLTG